MSTAFFSVVPAVFLVRKLDFKIQNSSFGSFFHSPFSSLCYLFFCLKNKNLQSCAIGRLTNYPVHAKTLGLVSTSLDWLKKKKVIWVMASSLNPSLIPPSKCLLLLDTLTCSPYRKHLIIFQYSKCFWKGHVIYWDSYWLLLMLAHNFYFNKNLTVCVCVCVCVCVFRCPSVPLNLATSPSGVISTS